MPCSATMTTTTRGWLQQQLVPEVCLLLRLSPTSSVDTSCTDRQTGRTDRVWLPWTNLWFHPTCFVCIALLLATVWLWLWRW